MGDFDNDGLVDLHTNEWLPHFLRSKQPDGSFASHARLLRNGAAGISQACCTLRATNRWALTGTPLQN